MSIVSMKNAVKTYKVGKIEVPALRGISLSVEEGDFLFSRANTIELVGACVIVKQISKRLMLSDKILRFGFAVISPKWVLVNLRTVFGRSEIERLATGNQDSMRNIGQDRIRQIRIPLPPLKTQQKIVAKIETERGLVGANKRLIEIFEKKIKDKIGEVWGE